MAVIALPKGLSIMKVIRIALEVIAISLAIISSVTAYSLWSKYGQAHQAEAALANMEANKPEQFNATFSPEDTTTLDSLTQLVVTLDTTGVLKVNKQDAGMTDDMSRLPAKLERIFRERRDRQQGRTVVDVPRSPKYEEATKVIDAVQQTGSPPVGLRVNGP